MIHLLLIVTFMWFSSTGKCTAGLKIVADEDFGDDRRIEVVFRGRELPRTRKFNPRGSCLCSKGKN